MNATDGFLPICFKSRLSANPDISAQTGLSEYDNIADLHRRVHCELMLFTSLVLVGGASVVALIASVIAALFRYFTHSNTLSLMAGTLALPAVICAATLYGVATIEVDDPPPGMVLIGNVVAIAVIVPIALLASHLTLKFLARRALRNDG